MWLPEAVLTVSDTVCPRRLGPICIVTYYINWVKTSWTYSMNNRKSGNQLEAPSRFSTYKQNYKTATEKDSCPVLRAKLRDFNEISPTMAAGPGLKG